MIEDESWSLEDFDKLFAKLPLAAQKDVIFYYNEDDIDDIFYELYWVALGWSAGPDGWFKFWRDNSLKELKLR